MAGQQETVLHIKHEERDHAVIGEALPELGGAQPEEAGRVADEGCVASVGLNGHCAHPQLKIRSRTYRSDGLRASAGYR